VAEHSIASFGTSPGIGAALEVVTPLFIPEQFTLFVPTDQLKRRCHVVEKKNESAWCLTCTSRRLGRVGMTELRSHKESRDAAVHRFAVGDRVRWGEMACHYRDDISSSVVHEEC
jgi:hypothetical protein